MLSHKDKVKYIFDNYYDKMDNKNYFNLSIPLSIQITKRYVKNDYFVNYIEIFCNSGLAIFYDNTNRHRNNTELHNNCLDEIFKELVIKYENIQKYCKLMKFDKTKTVMEILKN